MSVISEFGKLRDVNAKSKKKERKTTKFEITMIIEVVDVGDVPADASTLSDTVKEVIEGISSGDVVTVTEIATGTSTSRKS